MAGSEFKTPSPLEFEEIEGIEEGEDRRVKASGGSNLIVERSDCFIQVNQADSYNQTGSPFKIHLNFPSPEEAKGAWNVIISTLANKPNLIMAAKILDPELIGERFINQNQVIAEMEKDAGKKAENEEESFLAKANADAAQFIKEEQQRFTSSAQITIYLMDDKKGKKIPEIKALCTEIEAILQKKEIKFSDKPKPKSDYSINSYCSLRMDKKDGFQLGIPNVFMHENWKSFKNHELVKQLIDAKSIPDANPEFKPEPFIIRAVNAKFKSIKAERSLSLITDMLDKFPENEYKNEFEQIHKILNYKSLSAKEKLMAIVSISEQLTNDFDIKNDGVKKSSSRFKDLFSSKPYQPIDFFKNIALYEKAGISEVFNKLTKGHATLVKAQKKSKVEEKRSFTTRPG